MDLIKGDCCKAGWLVALLLPRGRRLRMQGFSICFIPRSTPKREPKRHQDYQAADWQTGTDQTQDNRRQCPDQ